MAYLTVSGLRKQFTSSRGAVTALDQVSFTAEAGTMLALLGPSGSGKTTLLRCISGLESPDAGGIEIDGAVVFDSRRGLDLGPERRRLGMIFQSYALWPHMRVEQIVAYPLSRRRIPRAEIGPRVRHYLDLVGCSGLADRYPSQLSGGQQQRIGLARALVAEPSLILFDEPLSNLDVNLREQLRQQIREIQKRIGFTGVYVTHDRAEAFFVADTVAVMQHGALLQQGSPDDVYRTPASAAVASFLGATNRAVGTVVDSAGGLTLDCDGLCLDLAGQRCDGIGAGQRCELYFRPDDLDLIPPAPGAITGQVEDVVSLGDHREYQVMLPAGLRWVARQPHGQAPRAPGEQVALRPRAGSLHLYAVAGEA